MYCVIRFADVSETNDLDKLGNELNQTVPGFYTGLDHVPHRFSCSVYPGETWELQRQAIIDAVARSSRFIERAQRLGVQVELDLAIEPQDYKGSWLQVSFDEELLQSLCRHRVPITLSIYGTLSETEEDKGSGTSGTDSL